MGGFFFIKIEVTTRIADKKEMENVSVMFH
jgi:hypothetical protein